RLARERHSPGEPAPARRYVLQPRVDQGKHLVAARFWLQELLARHELPHAIGVSAEAEVPILLLDPLENARGMQNAFAVDDLVVVLERLATDAIPALV